MYCVNETSESSDPIAKLGEKLGCEWETVARAKAAADGVRQTLD